MLPTRNSGLARGTSPRRMDASARGFALAVRTMNVAHRLRTERNIRLWQHRLAQATVTRVRNQAHDLKARAHRRGALERFADGVLPAEVLSREGPVNDRNARVRIVRAEITAVDERDLHGFHPAGRDVYNEGQAIGGRSAIDR